MVQTARRPPSPLASKAMCRPSGDQDGEPCEGPGPCVNWCALDPSADASQMSSDSPDRDEANTRRLPSGENCGWMSQKEETSTGRGAGSNV